MTVVSAAPELNLFGQQVFKFNILSFKIACLSVHNRLENVYVLYRYMSNDAPWESHAVHWLLWLCSSKEMYQFLPECTSPCLGGAVSSDPLHWSESLLSNRGRAVPTPFWGTGTLASPMKSKAGKRITTCVTQKGLVALVWSGGAMSGCY